MDTIEALKTRRSVRKYTGSPVPREILGDLVDCARLAPTANNVQPWEFVVVTEPAMLRNIARTTDYGRFIADAAACVAVLSKDAKYYLEDGSAATENILLAAHANGLGACWIAGDKKAYAGKVLQLIGAPDGYKLISLIPVGYPVGQPSVNKRPLSDVLHWEKY